MRACPFVPALLLGSLGVLICPSTASAQTELFSVKWKNNEPSSIAFSPDGMMLAVAIGYSDFKDVRDYHQVWVYDLSTKVRVAQLKRVSGGRFVGYRPDGILLTCADFSKGDTTIPLVQSWDTLKGKEAARFSLPNRGERDWSNPRLSPRGDLLADWVKGEVSIYDTKTGKRTGSFSFPDIPMSVALSPTSGRIALIDRQHEVSIFSVPKGERLSRFAVKKSPRRIDSGGITFSPKGDEIAFFCSNGEVITRFEALTGEGRGKPISASADNRILGGWYLSDHKTMVAATISHAVSLIDLPSRKMTSYGRVKLGHQPRVYTVSRDGKTVAMANKYGLRVWQLSSDPTPDP